MENREERDWVRCLGTVLIIVGVGMWIPYAVGKYLLGWQITDRDFLPYHLAVIIPGMLLRYYRFFFSDLWQRGRKSEKEQQDSWSAGQVVQQQETPIKALIILNSFIHDMVTGLWVSAVLAIYLLKTKTVGIDGALISPALHEVMRFFFWLGIASLVVILITGFFRIRYFRRETAAHERDVKKKLLIVKHVLLTTVFIGGTYLAYLYTFK